MSKWKGKRVVIVGAARQGTALARYLATHGASVLLNDHRTAPELEPTRRALTDVDVEWVLGDHPLELLKDADLVCLSGGVPLSLPLVVEAQRRGLPLSNDSQVFLEHTPCTVIGITGSAGKTTTTSLVGRMAQEASHLQPAAFKRVWVGGNIGNPLITNVDEMAADDLVVMELSSFQLEQMTRSPHVAAVLNVTPNHLDRHGTMEAYTRAKARILDYQNPGDKAVLGREDFGAWGLADSVRGALSSFGVARPPRGKPGSFLLEDTICLWDGNTHQALFPRHLIPLRGDHNLLNVLAACAIAAAANIPTAAMHEAVKQFEGVPHRLEFVRSWGGADWYNDSIATAPERAIAAIQSFDAPMVLLIGGRDKDLPWGHLADFVRKRVDHLVVFGEAADVITKAFSAQHAERPYSLAVCTGLKDAVTAAAQVARPGDVVLLAPGGTSFDEFADFAERGEKFRKWVNQLA